MLRSANAKVSANEWHTIKLRAEADRFSVSFKGRHLYTDDDATMPSPGKVALWTKADSGTRFERVEVSVLD